MAIFIAVLQAVLVLLGIGIVGFLITRRGIVPENVLGVLQRMAVDVALPCLVFANILVNFSPAKYPDWWKLPLWWGLFAVIALALSLITMFISHQETRAEFTINLFFQNGLFFPLIIISGTFGADAPYIPQLYIFAMLHPIMFFSTYNLFFRKKSTEKLNWSRIVNPIFIATIVAVGLQLAGVSNSLPGVVHSILEILGGMALPLIMIILGGSLYLDFRQKGKIYRKEIIKFLIIKNFVFPLVFLLVLISWQPAYGVALLFILEAAAPPVTATPILTERVGGNKAISNQFVFSSFVLSIVSIPGMFYLFNRFFPMP